MLPQMEKRNQMKLKPVLYFIVILAIISTACNLPITLQNFVGPTVTVTVKPGPATDTATETTINLTTPTLSPQPSNTPSPTVATSTTQPTATLTTTANIPVTGMGSTGQSTLAPVTFAPTVDPDKIYVGSCGTNQETITVVINQPDVVGTVILFDRLDALPDGGTTTFGQGTKMAAVGTGIYQATISAPPAKPVNNKSFDTQLDYKFAVLGPDGQIVAGSFTYNNIAVKVCKP